jgi:hypothetical protein
VACHVDLKSFAVATWPINKSSNARSKVFFIFLNFQCYLFCLHFYNFCILLNSFFSSKFN